MPSARTIRNVQSVRIENAAVGRGHIQRRTFPMATDYEPIIDQTLRLIHSQLHRYHRRLTGAVPDAVSVEQLRSGPLGQDLQRLARIARGDERVPAEQVFQSVRAILDLLLWPAGADTYEVQHPFWTEPLGKMLSQAKWRSVDRADLMSIG